MYETDPSLIRANVMRQGQGLQNDDTFNLMIDPYLDRAVVIFSRSTPTACVSKAYIRMYRRSIATGPASGKRSRTSRAGLDYRDPYSVSDNFIQSCHTEWGVNMRRAIRPTMKRWPGSRVPPDQSKYLRHARGFSGLQGLGLDVVPYIIAKQERTFGRRSRESSIEPQSNVLQSHPAVERGVDHQHRFLRY